MSTSESNEPLPFTLSEVDVRRQAVNTWRGYEYQLLQALLAWLRLPDDATLYLEIAEDHAVFANTQIEQTQVKNLASNITLRSDEVKDLMESHWRLKEANRDMKVVSVLLTTAKVGKEAKTSFPDNMPGLEYWRTAARDGTDVEPLRSFLLTLDLASELATFMREAKADELKTHLIRPIKWICSSDDLATVRQSVQDALESLGDLHGTSTFDSGSVCDLLLAEIKNKILHSEVRKVTKTDLDIAFKKAANIGSKVPAHSNQQDGFGAVTISKSPYVNKLTHVPLPPRVAKRVDLVNNMLSAAARKGILWLYGSSGLGKTTLAQLIGQSNQHEWLFVDLRDCSAQEVKYRLAVARENLVSESVRGVIVDDYPIDHSRNTILGLAQLTMQAHLFDAAVVITTTREPAPSIISRIGGENRVELREIPYLSEDEVSALIADAGGDPLKWTNLVLLHSGNGHPQLVDAKIVSLRNKNWADSELLADLIPAFASKEISAEKDVVRLHLMKELPEGALELLHRLSLAMNGFDKRLAMSIADAKEAIKRPGDAFTYLIGPWIERRGENRYALSPLVRGCGTEALSSSQQSAVRISIIQDLIQRKPFPAEQIGQLLLNAYVECDVGGLTWFAHTMQMCAIKDWKKFKLVAQEVSFFTLFPISESLFPSNKNLAALLRIVQCFVAMETDEERFPAIFDRTIDECRQIDDKTLSAGMMVMCIFRILARQGTGLSPQKWLPLVLELPQLMELSKEKGKSFDEALKGNPQGWSADQFLFVVQASTLKNVDMLSKLMNSLNELEKEKRNYFISALNNEVRSRRLTVDNAWVNQAKVEKLDGVALAGQYKDFAAIAESWGETDLQIDCICAQAVLLDEYADHSDEALSLIDEAIKKFGNDHRLLRRRQVILLYLGKHEDALAALPTITTGYSFDAIDLLYSLRDAGRSAFEIGHFKDARKYFSEAATAAIERTSQPLVEMSAGLLADAAHSAFEEFDYQGALEFLKQALIRAESIGSEPSNLEKYCLIILGHLSAWMNERADSSSRPSELRMIAGMCSDPNPSKEMYESVVPTTLSLWYLLALLEIKLGVKVNALSELRARTTESGYLGFEIGLALSQICAAIKGVDVEEFLRQIPNYLTVSMIPNVGDGPQTLVPVKTPIVPISDELWNEGGHFWFFQQAVIAFSLQAISCDKVREMDLLTEQLAKRFPLETNVGSFLSSLSRKVETFPSQGLAEVGAACVTELKRARENTTAEMAMGLTLYLWVWLIKFEYKNFIANDLAECMSSIWQRIITECRFMLKNPAVNVPAIETVINGNSRGAERLAELLLVVESAVSASLEESVRRELREFLNNSMD